MAMSLSKGTGLARALGLAVGLGVTLVAGAAGAEDAPAAGGLDLSIRARGLGIVTEPHAGTTLGLETMKAPTGEGTIRMPRAASGREPGLYVGVVVCDPDGVARVYQVRMDDAGSLPERYLRGTPGPRALFLPGRPTP
jgi:hypothetical protein